MDGDQLKVKVRYSATHRTEWFPVPEGKSVDAFFRPIIERWFPEEERDDLKFTFEDERLDRYRKMGSYEFEHGDELIIYREQYGMISNFSASGTDDPLVHYLMLTDDERQKAQVPLEELQQKASASKARKFITYYFDKTAQTLDSQQCILICKFLDFMWKDAIKNDSNGKANEKARVDMKLVLSKEDFCTLLEPLDQKVAFRYKASELIRTFSTLFNLCLGGYHSDEWKIVLRMTCGPTEACIPFHCDGGYATSTSQIALNDPTEYKGGKLCYFVNDKIHMLERPQGSVVHHPPKILHGVTNLTEGCRKGLFIVDFMNGHGDQDVLEVTEKHVEEFQETRKPRIPMCHVCSDNPVQYVLSPCGCLVYCEACADQARTRCPKCRKKIRSKIKMNLS